MKVLINFLSLFLFLTSISAANEVKVFEFTEAELSNLEVRKVRVLIIKQSIQLVQMIMEII
jgi:hypothetical protein